MRRLILLKFMRGLYIHLPFCRSKCPYCHFYSASSFDDETVTKYLNACLEEIQGLQSKSFDTIYIGGGTPSAIPPSLLDNFINQVFKKIDYSHREFTIEANPESVSNDFLAFINSSPITRVSLGVQSFDDDALQLLGRIHTSKTAIEATENLKKLNVDLNLDMIFDIPNINKCTILQTAASIISLGVSHVSAYSYTSEDTGYLTGFDPDDTQFFEIETLFNLSGLIKYETSNFAIVGKQSLHNTIYWTGDEYFGVGASSHSMVYDVAGTRIRYSKHPHIEKYIHNPFAYDIYETIDNQTSAKETLLTGLRLTKGINIENLEKRFGKFDKNLINKINDFIEKGMLQWNEKNLQTTPQGAPLLDSLSAHLWQC